MKLYAIDIGGSYVKRALVELNAGQVNIIKSFDAIKLTSNRFEDLLMSVTSSTGDALRHESQIGIVAISTTGSVDANGTVVRAGHFEDYANISWEKILLREFPQLAKVVTVNDGKASTWAEFMAQKSQPSVFAHFVVGTGIGGGIVVHGELLYGDNGYAGYLGHIKVATQSDVVCSCRHFGCVETFAAAPAIVRLYEAQCKPGREKMTTLADVTMAARGGDDRAVDAFRSAGKWLGIALSNVMNILNPAVITIGGGVVLAAFNAEDQDAKNVFIDAAVQEARTLALTRVAAETKICPAKYGNDGGLMGAALIAGG